MSSVRERQKVFTEILALVHRKLSLQKAQRRRRQNVFHVFFCTALFTNETIQN